MVYDKNKHSDIVKRSHQRSLSYGIEKERIMPKKILSNKYVYKNIENHRELLKIAVPFMQDLYEFLRNSGYFLILTDSDGCILNIIGDNDIINAASQMNMIVGAYMDEQSIGTNAMGTAITENAPIQISAKEHFLTAYHKWTCSAAPIKDINGEIIGCIDLTGYKGNAHPHTLGMVVAAADAIETMLEISKYNSMLEISKRRLETTFNSISSGILTCDLLGNITTMNSYAVKLFGSTRHEIKKMKVSDFLQNWEEIIQHINIKRDFINEDLYKRRTLPWPG